jgi:trk system potassium uptake protein TrkH
VLADVESLPRSLLLWRAVLHWFGGLGIVVLFVAVLPSLGVAGKRLFRSEATGPSKQGVRPQIRDTARILWFIYCGITALEIVALLIAGMDAFEAVCHSFATVATGGFSTRNASIAAYQSPSIEIIITLFMALSGVNFGLYDRLLRGQWRSVLRDPELRTYFAIMIAGIGVLTLALLLQADRMEIVGGQPEPISIGSAIRHSAFTASSMQTTTGFATADFDYWPFLAKAALVFLMFVGGCAGSTASGFKVIRFWIVLKVLHREFEKVFRPQIVRPVRLGGAALDDDLRLATVSFVLFFIILFALGSVLIMAFEHAAAHDGCTFTTASTASLATLSNVGPGLGLVGPSQNYGWFTTPSLMVMSLLMALGRLEIFAIIVLLMPRFWRGTA